MNVVPLWRQRGRVMIEAVNTLSCLLIETVLPAEQWLRLPADHVIGLLVTETLNESTCWNDTA